MPSMIYKPHSRQLVGICKPLATPMISIRIAPPTTRATASVNGSTCCNAILLNGNAVAQTAIVANPPIMVFTRFDIGPISLPYM